MKGAINLNGKGYKAVGFKTEAEASDYFDKNHMMVEEMHMRSIKEIVGEADPEAAESIIAFMQLTEPKKEVLEESTVHKTVVLGYPNFSNKDYYAEPMENYRDSLSTLIKRLNTPKWVIYWKP